MHKPAGKQGRYTNVDNVSSVKLRSHIALAYALACALGSHIALAYARACAFWLLLTCPGLCIQIHSNTAADLKLFDLHRLSVFHFERACEVAFVVKAVKHDLHFSVAIQIRYC